jgi:protein-disulfide isomerase
MKRIKKHFGDKVRIVFKHAPIDSHPNAKMAAQASLAAHAQGKFWALHDRLFQHHNSLSQSKIESLAQQAGLDMVRFRREMKAGTYANAVNQDSQLAQKLGATNTPSFFVNGIMLVGARPFFYFKRAVEAALAGKSIAAAVKKHTDKDTRPVKLYLQGAPTAGPTNAKVTVVEFSDFECGFCASAATTMQKLKKKYGNRVRFVFKHLPLKFHKKAKLAAIASMAANEQGKFWEFHDLLFKNQKKLGKPLYLRLARQLKLDMKAFKAALNSKKYDTRIAEDYAEGRWAGADGTPAFFVNGRRMMGVIPFDKLSQTIDAALKAK